MYNLQKWLKCSLKLYLKRWSEGQIGWQCALLILSKVEGSFGIVPTWWIKFNGKCNFFGEFVNCKN